MNMFHNEVIPHALNIIRNAPLISVNGVPLGPEYFGEMTHRDFEEALGPLGPTSAAEQLVEGFPIHRDQQFLSDASSTIMLTPTEDGMTLLGFATKVVETFYYPKTAQTEFPDGQFCLTTTASAVLPTITSLPSIFHRLNMSWYERLEQKLKLIKDGSITIEVDAPMDIPRFSYYDISSARIGYELTLRDGNGADSVSKVSLEYSTSDQADIPGVGVNVTSFFGQDTEQPEKSEKNKDALGAAAAMLNSRTAVLLARKVIDTAMAAGEEEYYDTFARSDLTLHSLLHCSIEPSYPYQPTY